MFKLSYIFFFLFILQSLNTRSQVKFCAVGDVLLDRGIRKTIEQNDVFYPFKNVKDIISNNDIAFYNNEFPFADSTDGFAINKKYSFRAEPKFIEGIKYAGFNVASVANNHTIDYGKNGFMSTLKILNENKIFTVGGGENQTEAFTPLLIEKNGQTFAFFANLEFLLEGTTFLQDKPYPAYSQIDRLCKQIEKYNSIVDFVIVSFHWGTENASSPNNRQIDFAHRVIDAGADLVIGQHPHVLQSIEIYRNKIILYSLGNFVFDNSQTWQKRTAIFQCTFDDGELKNPELIPISIVSNSPQVADYSESKEIFEHLQNISRGFKSSLSFAKNKILINYNYRKTVKELKYKKLNFDFYTDSISVYDDSYFHSGYNLPDTNYFFKDVCLLPKDNLINFYAIIKNKISHKSRLAVFTFSTREYKFARPSLDSHEYLNLWKVDLLDVDNDSVPELIVGVEKSTRYFKNVEKRIFVFNLDGAYFYPKWLGSKIGNPIVDFKIDKAQNKLILLEKVESNYKAFECKWNGFGFDLADELFDLDTNQSIKFNFQLSEYIFETTK